MMFTSFEVFETASKFTTRSEVQARIFFDVLLKRCCPFLKDAQEFVMHLLRGREYGAIADDAFSMYHERVL